MDKNKKNVPKTPSLATISPRLHLHSKHFKNDKTALPNKHCEKLMFQDLMQRSYITHHATSGYKKATPKIQRVYEGLRIRARELLEQVPTESSTRRRVQREYITTATTQPTSTLRTELLQLAYKADHEGQERLWMARRASTST
eukprot:5522409-Amphidinium_carterae.1